MNKSPKYNQQTEPKQCKSEVQKICIYQNLELESGRHRSIYIRKKNNGLHARKHAKQQYLEVVTVRGVLFDKNCIYIYNYAA